MSKTYALGCYGKQAKEIIRHRDKGLLRDATVVIPAELLLELIEVYEQASQPQIPEPYRKLEEWARKLPTPVCDDGCLPLASELNELDRILTEIGR